MSEQIKDNEFNADLKRKNSMDSNPEMNPRSSSFKNPDKFVRTKSGTFMRLDSDGFEQPSLSRTGTGRTGSTGMPDFR